MNACPVCEAPVVARVCDVCGHAFGEAGGPEQSVPQLEDLEVTGTSVGAVSTVPLSDLEPTRLASATPAVAAVWPENEWERTAVGEVPDVAAGGLAELDTGREAPASEHTPPTLASVTCRYCRNMQASGLLCDRCGMRLPWSARFPTAVAPQLNPDTLVRCQRCGERTYQRERCSSCGGVLASAS
jgi:hypothetical protein